MHWSRPRAGCQQAMRECRQGKEEISWLESSFRTFETSCNQVDDEQNDAWLTEQFGWPRAPRTPQPHVRWELPFGTSVRLSPGPQLRVGQDKPSSAVIQGPIFRISYNAGLSASPDWVVDGPKRAFACLLRSYSCWAVGVLVPRGFLREFLVPTFFAVTGFRFCLGCRAKTPRENRAFAGEHGTVWFSRWLHSGRAILRFPGC